MLSRCSACPGLCADTYCSAPIQPSGPSPCPVLLLGAGPGKMEARTHIPYTGLAGQELDYTYLAVAQLPRDSVAVGNATVCWDGTDRTPPDKRVLACAACHLPALLDRVRPEVVVLMGGATCRIADRRIRLDMHRGVPQWNSLLGGVWEGWVWPSYEPALGMRETSKMTQLLADFRHLGQWLRGEWIPPDPALEWPGGIAKDYQVARTRDDIQDYFDTYTGIGRVAGLCNSVAVDTEKHGAAPWSVQFSAYPHSGRLIAADSTDALHEIGMWLHGRDTILHNAPGDLDTLAHLRIVPLRYRDTMQEAYHQCALPQGLKPLAFRLLGVTMRSWEDVVWPASIQAALTWMEDAIALSSTSLQEAVTHELKRGRCADCQHQHTRGPCRRAGCGCTSTAVTHRRIEHKPSAAEAVLKHVLTYTAQTQEDDDPYNPWKKLAEMRVDGLRGRKAEAWEWEWLESELGPMPIIGIANCTAEEAQTYAIGDADMTGQVAEVLAAGRASERWSVAREDWDQ